MSNQIDPPSGILLINKPKGKTSFWLVAVLRRLLGVKKIGHAGTLDPFATGVMILLVGKNFTRQSDKFLGQDKEYQAVLHLGVSTDSYDCDGNILSRSDIVPSFDEINSVIKTFQGSISQYPPMFSAKKVNGKKLYELAREGITIERKPCQVTVAIDVLEYNYPLLKIKVACSKGTYIRSLAHDIGNSLGCGAHLVELTRLKSGKFLLEDCLNGELLFNPSLDLQLKERLITSID